MSEIMYDKSSIAIVVALFLSMALALECGFRAGRISHPKADDLSRNQVNTIQASLLGVLGLLLAFTLSLALQRFDSRSEAVVDEANAIGTTWLRTQLLPDSVRDEVQRQLRHYLDLRVRAGSSAIVGDSGRQDLLVRAAASQGELWKLAMRAATEDPQPVTSGLFVQALNEMIDSFGRRNAALDRHVPEVVLFLLFGTFLMTGVIVGYASGLSGQRASFVTYIMVVLIILLVFIIVDLDRPRRGLIEVRQDSLHELQKQVESDDLVSRAGRDSIGRARIAPGSTMPSVQSVTA